MHLRWHDQNKPTCARIDHMANKKTFKHESLYKIIAMQSVEEVLLGLQTTPEGITAEEAEDRLSKVGYNETAKERFSWSKQLRIAILNPFIILLTALAVVSYVSDDLPGAIVMATMALISLTLTFVQELRSGHAAQRLKAMVSTNCTVVRVSQKSEIPMSLLVPGDIIALSAGDMVPADCRLLTSKDLFISESQFTGESYPIEKSAKNEQTNLAFMGTNVVSGFATAVVIKTGPETYIGKLAESLTGHRVQTAFDKGIHRFTWLMLKFMMVMIPFVFLINGITKGDWYEALLFAVAVAVGLTPEMLPMIITVNLAKGAIAMSNRRVIVKRLNSIQNFGAMDVLCTDKTGTLTQDRVVLEKYVGLDGEESQEVLNYAYLNSFYQTGLKSLLDVAILKHVEINGNLAIEKHYSKIDEIPFDFQRKRMSVVVEKRVQDQSKKHIMICKGSIEELIKMCSHAYLAEKVVSISEICLEEALSIAQDFSDDGFRVIAVAYKESDAQKTEYTISDENELVLLGFVAFLDPPKETASSAILALAQYGVAVKVLTGDDGRVAQKVCRDVGIDAEKLLLGSEVESLDDDQLLDRVEGINLFAKLTPLQKERIVKALQRRKHVVGFLGDGINDAAALRTADVGISVDNAVDIAKESADIILLEKNLLVLEQGVIEGRNVFGNIIKYIKMGASSNFGNVFSVLGSSALLPFLPMRPVQLLAQNLLYDISQTAIPLDNVDDEYIRKPRRWEIANIGRFMLFMGPVSSIFDYITFAVMWFVFKANAPEHEALFQTGWFVEGLLSQTLIVHIIRTARVPFLQSWASRPLVLMTIFIIAAGIIFPFTHLGTSIGLVPLPLGYFPWLVGILSCYCVLTQLVKRWFIRRYGYL